MTRGTNLAEAIDGILEAPVVTSFTNLGYAARKRLFSWQDLDSYDLAGRTIAITGPTSGLGKAAALQMADMGAHLVLIARNAEKAAAVASQIEAESGTADVVIADMSDLDDVHRAAERIKRDHDRLDVLVHNAGALFNDRRTTPDGTEVTVRVHVEAPFLMKALLLDLLQATDGARVLTMSSGGMYTAPLSVDSLEMAPGEYDGAKQYARAKRAQVTLNELWASLVDGISFHSLHPGWADTPGVEESLPTFRKIVGPFLRDPGQGADTLVWLSADDGQPAATTGLFWHDRMPRSIHKSSKTRASDTPERRERLWRRLVEATGTATVLAPALAAAERGPNS